jgi:tetratricopeptide (TPR) repeat protein
MNVVLTPEEVEFNRNLDPRKILTAMGFAEDAISEEGTSIRLFCPIHKDQVLRSLVIDLTENKFHCQFKACPAHDGGHLIELLALYLGVDVPEAIGKLQDDSSPDQSLIDRADTLIEQGKNGEALEYLKEAVRVNPSNDVNRCKLAALYLEIGERDQGFREYLTAAEDFAVKNQTEKTLSIYNILVMLAPSDVRVRRQMAFLFSRLGRPREAAEQLKWVTDQLLVRGDIQDAVTTAREIQELCPGEPGIRLLLAKLLTQVHRINEAVAEASEAAELALEQGDPRTAEEAITFGLMYHPQHEQLLALEGQLRHTPVPSEMPDDERAQEDEFSQWLESLEEEVIEDEKPARAPAAASPMTSGVRREKWLAFCRQNLADLDPEKLNSMGQHLRSMFSEAETSFQAGTLKQWELEIVKDFYASFCLAYDQTRKAKSAPGEGT